MYSLYRTLTYTVSPLIPLLLKRRLVRGKEDATRIGERTGSYTLPRPAGKLVWIHAASVGETNSVLPLIRQLAALFPEVSVLLTTVTVTSARLTEGKLPVNAVHQFAPVDTPSAVSRFLAHWKPDVALWVDSEFWPNMIVATRKSGAVMGLINARMSPHSYHKWQKFGASLVRRLLSCFDFCFAQSPQDAQYLQQLGIPAITAIANLKYDAPALGYEEEALTCLQQETQHRPLWLASSTHPGEEEIIAQLHLRLKPHFPGLLTLIVPRHATRGDAIAATLKSHGQVAQRTQGQPVVPDTEFYIADTMGELGLFYRLAPVVLMGGTLVPHGGQNALEPARIGCAIITGEHYHNFISVVEEMAADNAIIKIRTQDELFDAVKGLLEDKTRRHAYSEAARQHAHSKSGALQNIVDCLGKYLVV